MEKQNKGDIVIYQTKDGLTKIDVRFDDETVWLTQAQLVELYKSSKANVSEHIKHIFEEGELAEESTVRKFRTVQIEGEREVSREQTFYNLDMIISLGYRIKSGIATQFRRWATEILKEYLKKGYAESIAFFKMVQKNLSPVEQAYLIQSKLLKKK
ncbi:virulence RhuM family protein [Treponema berlinense]|uniref:virulence RhuM family protein n=1 Tax=Treponema berlinense TaxID=225004 RepID=UPI003FD85891